MRQTINRGALGKRRFVYAAVIGTILAAGDGKFQTAFTLEHRQRGKRHGVVLLAAVGLFHGDLQIARPAGRVHIGNFKGTR
ncbi:hypothetical protein D3C74_415260 [compost metagenome]